MEVFTKNKLLVQAVILLVILNIASAGVFLWKGVLNAPAPPGEERVKPESIKDVSAILEKELNLTEKQAAGIKKIREDFFAKEKELEKVIRSQRDSMNAAMFSKSTDDALVRSLARRIADGEYAMEILRFEQSKEFKSICTPEQLGKFEKLVKEIRDYFKPEKNNK